MEEQKAFRAKKLGQLLDVSRQEAQDGDSLVWDATNGHWTPANVTPGDGDITTNMVADAAITTTKIEDGAVSDDKIGPRTITDTVVPDADTAPLTTLLSGIGNIIKAITGKASWRTAPSINLESLNLHKARHAMGGDDALSPTDIGAAQAAHTHPDATGSVSGFLSAVDKTKLDTIASGAAALTSAIPQYEGVGATALVGSTFFAARSDHRHQMPGLATPGTDGFMSSADKVKLNQLSPGFFVETKNGGDHTFGANQNYTLYLQSYIPASSIGKHIVHVTVDLDWVDPASVIFIGELYATNTSPWNSSLVPQSEALIFQSPNQPVRQVITRPWVVEQTGSGTLYIVFRAYKSANGVSGSQMRAQHTQMLIYKV